MCLYNSLLIPHVVVNTYIQVILNRNNLQANTGGVFRVNIPNANGDLTAVHIGIYPDNGGMLIQLSMYGH